MFVCDCGLVGVCKCVHVYVSVCFSDRLIQDVMCISVKSSVVICTDRIDTFFSGAVICANSQ